MESLEPKSMGLKIFRQSDLGSRDFLAKLKLCAQKSVGSWAKSPRQMEEEHMVLVFWTTRRNKPVFRNAQLIPMPFSHQAQMTVF